MPVYNIGDTWQYKAITNKGDITIITSTVTGETKVNGKDHYLTTSQIASTNTIYPTVSYEKVDKEFLDITESIMTKERDGKLLWINLKTSWIHSTPPYHMEVGKKSSSIKTTTIDTNNNNTTSPEKIVIKYSYHIDCIENVTVPAGTFECFKISRYNENNELIDILWPSIEVKYLNVKEVNFKSGRTVELIYFIPVKK